MYDICNIFQLFRNIIAIILYSNFYSVTPKMAGVSKNLATSEYSTKN